VVTTKLKGVVFDVGAVLIDWDPRNLYRKMLPDDAAIDKFLTDICPYDWNLVMDKSTDVTWDQYVTMHAARHPDHADLIRAYHERWPEMVTGPIQGSVDIKAQLRAAGIPIYAITNYSREKWALSQTLWPFLADFDGIICSGIEGVMKPDPAIYRLLYDRYNLNPADYIFIDDRQENINAAIQTGMHGYVFKNPDDLRIALSAAFPGTF